MNITASNASLSTATSNLNLGVVTSGGTATAQTLTYPNAPAAYSTGDVYRFTVGVGLTNTGATTININGLGAQAVQIGGLALTAGKLVAGQYYTIAYDGAHFQLVDMATDASNASLPIALTNLGASQIPHQNPAIVCDASTDNAPAIQAAINAIAAASPNQGGVVVLPNCAKIAIASELYIHTSNIVIEGAGGSGSAIPQDHQPSAWYNLAPFPAATVIGWNGMVGAADMVRFEPDAYDSHQPPNTTGNALTGGGLRGIVLAGLGNVASNLMIRSMRGGQFDDLTLENCTGNCLDVGVTTNSLATPNYGLCDTQTNVFRRTQVHLFPGMSSGVDNATAIHLSGLLWNSPTPYGCDVAEVESNTSFNSFYETRIQFKNGTGIDFAEAVDNRFYGVIVNRSPSGTGNGIVFECANSSIWQARRNRLYNTLSNFGPIISRACSTSYNTNINFDSASQNYINVSTSVQGQKPTFDQYAPQAEMYWDATDGDNNYLGQGQPSYQSGRFYLPRDVGAGTLTNGTAPGLSTIVCRAGTIPRMVAINSLVVWPSTTDSGKFVQAAVYADDGNGRPSALVSSSGSGSTGSATAVQMTLSSVSTPYLGAGSQVGRLVWFCTNTNSGIAAFSTFGASGSSMTALVGSSSAADATHANLMALSCAGAACNGGSSTFGTWPSSLSGSTWTEVLSTAYAAVAFKVN
jgi:hypothetical protein